ncbi:MAG: hypothetical protein JKY65_32260 [Planctomycetes bacterium]|nr:hypothetical protein [Planctomycetota bacterium]
MGVLEVLFVLGGVGLFVIQGLRQAAENRTKILARVVPLLTDGALGASGITSHLVTGSVNGRRVVIEVGYRPFTARGSDARYPIRARLQLRHAPNITVRIRRDAGLAALQKLTGYVTDVEVAEGDPFDEKYLVEAHSDAARAGLAARDVRSAIHRLIAFCKLDEVRLGEGWLEVRGDPSHLNTGLFLDLLETLDMLAHTYDRSPAPSIAARPVFAWKGGRDSKTRCPYCHDALEDATSEAGACHGCGTLIHTVCHEELGRCPIMGCEGRSLERQGPIPI